MIWKKVLQKMRQRTASEIMKGINQKALRTKIYGFPFFNNFFLTRKCFMYVEQNISLTFLSIFTTILLYPPSGLMRIFVSQIAKVTKFCKITKIVSILKRSSFTVLFLFVFNEFILVAFVEYSSKCGKLLKTWHCP